MAILLSVISVFSKVIGKLGAKNTLYHHKVLGSAKGKSILKVITPYSWKICNLNIKKIFFINIFFLLQQEIILRYCEVAQRCIQNRPKHLGQNILEWTK